MPDTRGRCRWHHDAALLAALERLHQQHLGAGRHEDAARAAFWSGFRLYSIGESGRATAWLKRAERQLAEHGAKSVLAGYLMLPAAQYALMSGDLETARDRAGAAVGVGERFEDSDLVAFARNMQGRALIRQGRIPDGLALLDEAMLAVTSDELTPMMAGLVYCSVIATCCRVYAIDRAREWTEALSAWCRDQPQLVAFSGICMVHRSEILQMNGDWSKSISQAQNAFRHLAGTVDRDAAAAARYQEADICRLRGEFAAAERAYRESSYLGHEPQPGLALLRLAQGRGKQAAASIRRVLGAHANSLQRARFLPAFVEIMLAAEATEEAAWGSSELEAIADRFGTDVLQAMALHARGAVALAAGDAAAAFEPLRQSFSIWQRLEAPYLAARVRVLVARACLALGDEEGATLECDAARAVFEKLGAAPDLADQVLVGRATRRDHPHGLSRRELEVLRLIATGKTNRLIADELGLSGKTIDRHVGNIFDKLDVSSRAAATAYAYRARLL